MRRNLQVAHYRLPPFCAPVAGSQDVVNNPKGQQIPGPQCSAPSEWNSAKARTCRPDEYAAWLADVRHWRSERRARIGFDPSQYDRPEFQWAQSSFVQPQMMVHDRYFYDPATLTYTVDKYLKDVNTRYGGIDSVLLWPPIRISALTIATSSNVPRPSGRRGRCSQDGG